jgi:hypothetical protein
VERIKHPQLIEQAPTSSATVPPLSPPPPPPADGAAAPPQGGEPEPHAQRFWCGRAFSPHHEYTHETMISTD